MGAILVGAWIIISGKIVTLMTAGLSVWVAYLNSKGLAKGLARNHSELLELKISIDGRLTQLMDAKIAESRLLGAKEEREK